MSRDLTPPTWDYDPARWELVQEVFLGAEGLGGARLGEYLDRKCAGDEKLRAQVEDLLRGADGAADLIDGAVARGLKVVGG